MEKFVPVAPADGAIHPKVKAAGIVGAVVTVLAAVAGVLGVQLDAGSLTDAVLILVGAGSAVVAGYRKAAG